MSFAKAALDLIGNRRQAYVATFAAEREFVMTDLAKFCRAFGEDPDKPNETYEARLVEMGRREVFWRIWRHLNLTEVELAAVYRAAQLETGE
jgi:hypothetical protein